jgi:hypothetical protein
MAIVVDKSGNIGGLGFTDQKFNSNNRTAATTAAVMALTPQYPGEVVMALDSGLRFRGLELVAGRWGQIVGEVN